MKVLARGDGVEQNRTRGELWNRAKYAFIKLSVKSFRPPRTLSRPNFLIRSPSERKVLPRQLGWTRGIEQGDDFFPHEVAIFFLPSCGLLRVWLEGAVASKDGQISFVCVVSLL